MESLRYPLSGESPARTIVLGVTLSALGLLVVPALAVTGYYGRVLARSSRGDSAPTFGNVPGLLADGLRTWLVFGTYLIAGVVVLLLFAFAAIVLGGVNTGLGAEVGALALVMLALLALGLFAFPTWYFVPAALTELARERRVGAAFDFGAIRRVVFDRRYFLRWLVGCGLVFVGSVAYSALVLVDLGVPLVDHVVGVAVNFYSQTAAFHCFGRGYALATGDATTDRAESRIHRGEGFDVRPEDDLDVRRDDDCDAPHGWSDERGAEPRESAELDSEEREPDEWGADAIRWRERRDRE